MQEKQISKFAVWFLIVVFGGVSVATVFRPSYASAELMPLVISSVQTTGGAGKASEDYIELYNPNNEPVNLNGYRLVKRTELGLTDSSIKSWSTDEFIPAYSFYLWANSTYSVIPISPDAITSTTIADNNGVGLRYGSVDTGELVDSLAWGSANNGFTQTGLVNPVGGESIIRSSLFDVPAYEIAPSNPRNSSFQELPPAEEIPPEDEPPIDIEPQPEDDTDEEPPIDSEPEDEPEDDVNEQRTVKITELMPNPSGEDSGKERVELYNYGDESINLDGWVLDDISDNIVSTNAFVFSDAEISPNEYLEITIPVGKFALNNSDGDSLTLLNASEEVISTVNYDGSAPEDQSYSLIQDEWFWVPESFGEPNPVLHPEVESEEEEDEPEETVGGSIDGLIISEIYPAPNPGELEFIEIYNSSDDDINLANALFKIGNRKVSLPNFLLKSRGYYSVHGEDLDIQLANAGKLVQLMSAEDVVVDSVEYPKSIMGQSYSLFEDNFKWTLSVTSGETNVYTSKPVEVSTATVTNKSDSKPAVKKSTKKVATASKKVVKPTDAVKKSVKTESENKLEKATVEEDKKRSTSPINVIAIGVAMLSTGAFAVYKYGFGGGWPF